MLDVVVPSLTSTGTAERCGPASQKAWFELPGLSEGLSIQP